MVYGYIRVSTGKQVCENQKLAIRSYCQTHRGVKVIAIKERYELGDNIQSKVLAFAFGLSAEIERTLISERTKQGLERARKAGKHIGRRKGQASSHYKLTGKGGQIRRARLAGKSKSEIARKLGVTWITLHRYMVKRKIK